MTTDWINYCSTESTVFGDFCKGQPSADRYQSLQNYCNVDKIKNRSLCSGFVLKDAAGKVDHVMHQYCKEYPNDDICACIVSKIPCPHRFDSRCANNDSTYKTSSMLQGQCPELFPCNEYELLNSDLKKYVTNRDMVCHTEDGRYTSGDSIIPLPPHMNDTQPPPSKFMSSQTVHIFTVIFLFLVIIFIAVFKSFYKR